jgi:hypothetical protein
MLSVTSFIDSIDHSSNPHSASSRTSIDERPKRCLHETTKLWSLVVAKICFACRGDPSWLSQGSVLYVASDPFCISRGSFLCVVEIRSGCRRDGIGMSRGSVLTCRNSRTFYNQGAVRGLIRNLTATNICTVSAQRTRLKTHPASWNSALLWWYLHVCLASRVQLQFWKPWPTNLDTAALVELSFSEIPTLLTTFIWIWIPSENLALEISFAFAIRTMIAR